MIRFLFLALALALVVFRSAQTESAWARFGSLGINMSRGVTSTDSAPAKLAASCELGRWVYNFLI